jgi:hypothetical protein
MKLRMSSAKPKSFSHCSRYSVTGKRPSPYTESPPFSLTFSDIWPRAGFLRDCSRREATQSLLILQPEALSDGVLAEIPSCEHLIYDGAPGSVSAVSGQERATAQNGYAEGIEIILIHGICVDVQTELAAPEFVAFRKNLVVLQLTGAQGNRITECRRFYSGDGTHGQSISCTTAPSARACILSCLWRVRRRMIMLNEQSGACRLFPRNLLVDHHFVVVGCGERSPWREGNAVRPVGNLFIQ